MYQQFRDWRDNGTSDRVIERLHVRLNQERLIDLDTWMIDSVSATRASSSSGKKGPEEPVDHALGPSRDDLTTKIYIDLERQRPPPTLCIVDGSGQRHLECLGSSGSSLHPWQAGPFPQTLLCEIKLQWIIILTFLEQGVSFRLGQIAPRRITEVASE